MSRAKFKCIDCKVDTGRIYEHYMLWDEIWDLTSIGKVGMLCVGCCEQRIGRSLYPADFNDSYVNELMPQSQRLINRRTKIASLV